MDVLVGSHSDGWNRQGYVALMPGPTTEVRRDLAELVAVLKRRGVQRSAIRLASNQDGTHSMNGAERVQFWQCWDGSA